MRGETREALARAIYETAAGTNGYPPLHRSIPWNELMFAESYYERADRILSLLAKRGADLKAGAR